MKKSLSRNQFNHLEPIFISDLAKIEIISAREINEQCWRTYYQDLATAALKISSLKK